MRVQLCAMILVAALASCQDKRADVKAEGTKLMQVSRDWSQVASTGDIERTLSYWADDATILSPGQPALKGKQAIRGMLEESSKIPGFKISWEPKSVTVSGSGDMAWMEEENQITMNDSVGKPFTLHNRAVTIWRKDSKGDWKNVMDIWNAPPQNKK